MTQNLLNGRFPKRLLTATVFLSTLVLVWLGWETYLDYRNTKESIEHSRKIYELRGTILHLDEVLTMSARLAVLTGDARWEDRYRRFEPILDSAIKQAITLVPEAYKGKSAEVTEAANLKLVQMENDAMKLAREGQKEKAQAILFSAEYERQKQIYASGMTRFAVTQDHALRLEELAGIITHLDEVLTMSARMSAMTGDPRWASRYWEYEPTLDSSIKEAMRMVPETVSGASAAKTDVANLKLVELESKALELVGQGLNTEAKAILFSSEYEEQKKIYSEGMQEFHAAMERAESQARVATTNKALLKLSIAAFVILLLMIGLGVVLNTLKRWQARLIQNNTTLSEQAAKLQEWNRVLDEKVEERTRQLEEQRAVVLQSEKMAAVGRLAGGVAHEINNPLGVILGFAQALSAEVKDDDPKAGPFRIMEREAVRCKGLVQDLLTFSRASKAQKIKIDINGMIDSALTLIHAQARLRNIEIIRDFQADLPPFYGNENQLQQVVVNLCTNAMDAMSDGKILTLRTRCREAQGQKSVVIDVEDQGQGIPAQIHEKVFEPFFTTKEVGKGTGLGLSLVYEIVKNHHGRVSFESEIGKGTVFSVWLPYSATGA